MSRFWYFSQETVPRNHISTLRWYNGTHLRYLAFSRRASRLRFNNHFRQSLLIHDKPWSKSKTEWNTNWLVGLIASQFFRSFTWRRSYKHSGVGIDCSRRFCRQARRRWVVFKFSLRFRCRGRRGGMETLLPLLREQSLNSIFPACNGFNERGRFCSYSAHFLRNLEAKRRPFRWTNIAVVGVHTTLKVSFHLDRAEPCSWVQVSRFAGMYQAIDLMLLSSSKRQAVDRATTKNPCSRQ